MPKFKHLVVASFPGPKRLFGPGNEAKHLVAYFDCQYTISLPGKVNFIGSSHQWWHLMVVVAFAWAHHIAVVIFLYWRVHKCSSSALALSSTVDITVTVIFKR